VDDFQLIQPTEDDFAKARELVAAKVKAIRDEDERKRFLELQRARAQEAA
jgi:hypothetical protein